MAEQYETRENFKKHAYALLSALGYEKEGNEALCGRIAFSSACRKALKYEENKYYRKELRNMQIICEFYLL